MKKIKEYWEKLMKALRSNTVIFVSPLAIFLLWLLITKNIFAFSALIFWVLVLIANTDED